MINFSQHLKLIKRQSEPDLDLKIKKMHKRERNFPFNKELENASFSLNQKNLNYPSLTNLYKGISKNYDISPDEIILTSGCDIALRTIYESLSSLEFLHLPNSCYAMNFIYKKIYHPKAIQLNFEYNHKGMLDIDELKTIISANKGSQMLVIESPSGFTGQELTKRNFESILEFCNQNNIVLVVDETYLETRFYTWTAKDYLDYKNLIVVRSFSKAYGIAGLRAGLIISNKANIEILKSLLPMHEVTSFTKDLLLEILKDSSIDSFRKQIESDEDYINQKLNNVKGFKILKTKANFILFKNINFSNQYIHDYLLSKLIKIKIHKKVPEFGEWCSASLGNDINNKELCKALFAIK